MTTLTGASGLGKIGVLSPFSGIVVSLTGDSGIGKAGHLSFPSFIVPNVVDTPVMQATLTLQSSSFKVGNVSYSHSDTVILGNVIQQTPAFGSTAVQNTSVDLQVSSGPISPVNNPIGGIRLPNLPNKILPPDNALVDKRGIISPNWWRFILNVSNQAMGTNETVPSTVEVGPSPFDFSPSAQGTLLVAGGPVSLIEYSKDGKTWYPMGVTQGQIQIAPNDHVRITYMNPPTLTFFPR